MPTALIAEDEPLLRAQLKARLARRGRNSRSSAEAENGEEALALADEHATRRRVPRHPDAARLGLEVARALAGRCHVVFVTAYDEYAVAAFDEGAVDYC